MPAKSSTTGSEKSKSQQKREAIQKKGFKMKLLRNKKISTKVVLAGSVVLFKDEATAMRRLQKSPTTWESIGY